MAKRGRRLLKALLFVVLLVVIATLAINLFRLTSKPAEPVLASVMRQRNAFVDFYGARNGLRVLLFDAGTDPTGRSLDALLGAMKVSRDEVTDLFLTHGHRDHLGAATLLLRARVHAGAGDRGLIEGTDGQEPISARPLGWMQVGAFPKVGDPLAAPTDVSVGAGQSVKAIPLPGHTAGSFAYLWQGVLFVGDSLEYDAKTGKLGPAVKLFSVDNEQNRRSIAGLRGALAGARVDTVCTGHGGCTPPGETQKLLDELIQRMQ
jgi:glyoxylase-like metal-dependent hydrolase (beta-lactamase superfamily II)